MGLLEPPSIPTVPDPLSALSGLLNNPFKRKVKKDGVKPDFPAGFIIVEFQNGKALDNERIALVGNMMPHTPFEYGGEQRIQKEYYPGHSEPSVQVFGPKESDTVIKGKFKDKRYKDKKFAGISEDIAQQIDAIRIRGNICRFTMGEWTRYGFIEKTNFGIETLRSIDYQITLNLIGFNPPTDNHLTGAEKVTPLVIQKSLIAEAAAFEAGRSNIPPDMPQSIAGFLNEQISAVATSIGIVTGFVDNVIKQGEAISNSANRVVGLVRNARRTIAVFHRRVGGVVNSVANLGPNLAKEVQATGATVNALFIKRQKAQAISMSSKLAAMEKQFEALRKKTPANRHLVKASDTLQSISIKYYNNAGDWNKIYTHNKLSSTELVVGSVLEIPRAD